MEEKRNTSKLLVRKHEGKNHSEYMVVNGRMTLKLILRKWCRRM
jgi:hypothetical protein